MQKGHSEYSFSLIIPEWLPESIVHRDGNTMFLVSYFLTAQLEPRSDDLYANKQRLSLCRDDRCIYIYREQGSHLGLEEEKELSKVLRAKIGGVFGLGSNFMETVISLDKTIY